MTDHEAFWLHRKLANRSNAFSRHNTSLQRRRLWKRLLKIEQSYPRLFMEINGIVVIKPPDSRWKERPLHMCGEIHNCTIQGRW